MHVAIIGAGPTGLFLGAALARRGHRVTAVDRDAGPAPDGGWSRRGVMQFHHAHGFRPQIVDALQAEVPEALRRLGGRRRRADRVHAPRRRDHARRDALAAGDLRACAAHRRRRDPRPDPAPRPRRRRWSSTARAPAAWWSTASDLPADLVVDASGRAGRATRPLRAAPAITGRTGVAYVDRQYRLRPGAEPGPMTNPLAWQADLDGYQVIVFRHERGMFSVLIVRPDRRSRPRSAPERGRLRRGLPDGPGPRRLDRPGARRADRPGARRRRAGQPLPRPGGSGRERPPGLRGRGRRGRHDDADVRPRDHDLAPAGPRAAPAPGRRRGRRGRRGRLRHVVRGAHAALGGRPRPHGHGHARPVGGSRRRPHPPPAVRPRHGRGAGRARPSGRRRGPTSRCSPGRSASTRWSRSPRRSTAAAGARPGPRGPPGTSSRGRCAGPQGPTGGSSRRCSASRSCASPSSSPASRRPWRCRLRSKRRSRSTCSCASRSASSSVTPPWARLRILVLLRGVGVDALGDLGLGAGFLARHGVQPRWPSARPPTESAVGTVIHEA